MCVGVKGRRDGKGESQASRLCHSRGCNIAVLSERRSAAWWCPASLQERGGGVANGAGPAWAALEPLPCKMCVFLCSQCVSFAGQLCLIWEFPRPSSTSSELNLEFCPGFMTLIHFPCLTEPCYGVGVPFPVGVSLWRRLCDPASKTYFLQKMGWQKP